MYLTSKMICAPRTAAFHSSRRCVSHARTVGALTDRIKRDHQEIREYAENIRNAKDQNSKATWQNQFTWQLARHAIAEELVVYPAFERLGPEGRQRAEKDRSQHQSVGHIGEHPNVTTNTIRSKMPYISFRISHQPMRSSFQRLTNLWKI